MHSENGFPYSLIKNPNDMFIITGNYFHIKNKTN